MLAVQLTASDALQPVIDQILAAQQQIVSSNSGLSFVTPFDLTHLDTYAHGLSSFALTMLNAEMASFQFNDPTELRFPYLSNANAAEPASGSTAANPDNNYHLIPVEPDRTLELTVRPGPGSPDMTFTVTSGNQVTSDINPIPGQSFDLSHYTANPDGTYTIALSSTAQSGNWIDTAGAKVVIVRDENTAWGLPHDTISLQDEGASAYTLPVLSHDQISSVLSTIATSLPNMNSEGSYLGTIQPFTHIPANTMTPIAPLASVVPGGGTQGAGLQVGSLGRFSLEPNQALVVKVPDVEAAGSSAGLYDTWLQPSPYVTATGSLSNVQAFHDPDGFTYYVISSQDPGVANWLDTSGATNGDFVLRWQSLLSENGVPTTPVQTQVVNIDDVRNYLPADTPTVTPAQHAADVQERLLQYDYRMDQANEPTSWVTTNLEVDQFKAVMGVDQYNAVFGGQQDVPSVMDRMTESALMPNLGTVAHDFFAHPIGSLTAIVENFPLLVKDIELPMVLAALRIDMLLGHAPGASTLATILSQTFTDPATSVTAGFLNARDDLAVSIMNGDSYSHLTSSDFTSVWDQLVELQHSVSQMLAGGIDYLFDSVG